MRSRSQYQARFQSRSRSLFLALFLVVALGAAAPGTCFRSAQVLSPPLPPLPGNDAELSFNFKKSVATLPDGSVHATWHSGAGAERRVFYRRSLDGGVNWEAARVLSSPGVQAEHPAITASAGRVYVGWHHTQGGGGAAIVLRRSGDAGASFAPPVALSSSGSSAHASLAAFGPNVYAVWGDTATGNDEILLRASSDGGASFGPEIEISERPYESWVPSVSAHGTSVAVAWVDYRDGNEEEYVRTSHDAGASWGPLVRVTEDPADSWAPSVVVRPGAIFLSWFDRRAAGLLDAEVELALNAAATLVGLNVSPPPPRDPADYYLPGFNARLQAKLAAIETAAPAWIASGGDPAELDALLTSFHAKHAVWARGWAVYLSRSFDGGATWEAARQISQAGGPALRPSLAVTASGLHVTWFDGRHGEDEVYYRYSPNPFEPLPGFGPERRITFAPGESRRPSLAAIGKRVHLLWADERVSPTRIFHARGDVLVPEDDGEEGD